MSAIFDNDIRKRVLFTSALLFTISLPFDCYNVNNQGYPAIEAFLFGWLGIALDRHMLAWLANPFLMISWATSKTKTGVALGFSLLAVATALLPLVIDFAPGLDYKNESFSIISVITQYRLGYWMWLLSCCTMVTGNGVIFYRIKEGIIKN